MRPFDPLALRKSSVLRQKGSYHRFVFPSGSVRQYCRTFIRASFFGLPDHAMIIIIVILNCLQTSRTFSYCPHLQNDPHNLTTSMDGLKKRVRAGGVQLPTIFKQNDPHSFPMLLSTSMDSQKHGAGKLRVRKQQIILKLYQQKLKFFKHSSHGKTFAN